MHDDIITKLRFHYYFVAGLSFEQKKNKEESVEYSLHTLSQAIHILYSLEIWF